MTARAKLSEEAKFELSMAAASRERANRPVGLVAGAAVVLVAGGVFAAYAMASRAAARGRLERAVVDQAMAEARVEEWRRLAESAGAMPTGGTGEFRVSRMEELAVRAGMKSRPNAPVTRDDKSRPGVVVYSHIYVDVRDPSLAAMIEWMRMACAEIAGLEVEALTVRPEPAGWKMDVTFRRWERTGS